MSYTTRAVTAPKTKKISITNQSPFGDVGIIGISKDRDTFYSCDPSNKLTLRFSSNYATSPSSPTWTTSNTFPELNASFIDSIVELYDGEVLVYLSTTTQSVQTSRVFRSTGWATSKTTATWTLVLSTFGGAVTRYYSSSNNAIGKNGIVLVNEAGSQTSGGDRDAKKAINSYISSDYGATFTPLFNLVDYAATQGFPNPSGVHLHGIAYDEDWDRIWINYGDNTGDGKKIADIGYTQTIYSDDRGLTWVKLPMPNTFSVTAPIATNKTLQFIGISSNDMAVMFTPDVSMPTAPVIFPKIGYRKLGSPFMGPTFRSGTGATICKLTDFDQLDSVNTESNYNAVMLGGRIDISSSTGTFPCTVMYSPNLLDWYALVIQIAITAKTSYGFIDALGPTTKGKVVLIHSSTFNTSDKVIIGDLVFD